MPPLSMLQSSGVARSTPLKPTPPKGPPPPVAPQKAALVRHIKAFREGQLTEEHSDEQGLDEGMELFRELSRFLPTVKVASYYNTIILNK